VDTKAKEMQKANQISNPKVEDEDFMQQKVKIFRFQDNRLHGSQEYQEKKSKEDDSKAYVYIVESLTITAWNAL
jgi:hypothetical protein